MLKLSIASRAASAVALICTIVAMGVISAPTASAQSGSRLCGRLVASSGAAYTLYLVEVNKNSQGSGEFDADFQRCENAQQRWVDSRQCNYAECYEYTVCEDLSGSIGWSRFTGNAEGYNPNDICTSMKRGTLYRLELSDRNNVTSIADA